MIGLIQSFLIDALRVIDDETVVYLPCKSKGTMFYT